MSDLIQETGMKAIAEAQLGFLLTKPNGQTKSRVQEAWFWKDGDARVRHEKGSGASALIQAANSLVECYRREIQDSELVIPTGFDLQVHLRHPGQSYKETLAGGLASAIVGGYDSILTMPNTKPFLDAPEPLRAAIAEVDRGCPRANGWPDVFFSASGTKGMQGEEVADIAALVEAGATAITDDGWGVKSEQAMADIFAACAESDVPFLQHAEMPGHGGHASPSAYQKKHGIPAYPRTAESKMVARDVKILKNAPKGTRYHVLHISTRETLEEIHKAKEAGLAVTCEVTPHHLFFANTDFIEPTDVKKHTDFKMNPPIFAPEDREALRLALQDGLIDCVSTDHAPHEEEAKRNDWQYAAFGTRGLVTALPTLVTLHRQGLLSLDRLIEVYAYSGRRVLGNNRAGDPRGLVIVDKNRAWTVTNGDLPGVSQNSCFLGSTLYGRVEEILSPNSKLCRA